MEKYITIFTMAGLVGLFVLNADKATTIVNGFSKAITAYVGTVQGR